MVLVTSAGSIFAQTTVNKSYSGVKRIRLKTGSGDCEIKKSAGTSVEVELKYTYDTNDYTPRFEQSGERLTLGEDHSRNSSGGNASWKISVPDGVTIDVNTGSGDVTASGVNINLDANTGSGDLGFSSLKGELDANTGSGNVDIASFSGNAKVNTGSGDMEVRETDGDLDLNCGSGDIIVSQAKGYFAVNTGSGNINADRIQINSSSKFNTGSGRARITLSSTPKADILVNSGSGNAELNFNGNPIEGEVVMRASKRHGRITAPFEFDKTEEISYDGKDNVTIVKTAQKGKATNRISVSTGSGDAVLRQ